VADRACILWVLVALAPGICQAGCAELTALSPPGVSIRSAVEVGAGDSCRVSAVATPSADSEIHFEVWIPGGKRWNGKLLGTGNGGFAGSINYAAMATALARGYATVGSDTGHSGDQMEFGEGHPQKVIDWAHRAVHVTTQAAQFILRQATGQAPQHSYFEGCSTGGQQALSEAQRYPEDYDGIIAGAPGNDRVRLILGFLWSWAALHDEQGEPLLGSSQLALLTREVTKRCDAVDGLKDGLVSDPRRCRFDPEVLACRTGASSACLTPVQVQAVNKVYGGARNARTGEQVFPGWVPGSEMGWGTYLIDPPEPPRLGLFRYFAFHDRTWDWHEFDWDRDVARVQAQVPELNAVSRDLSRFRARGGRLVMYAGWADPVVPATNVVSYYESAARAAGGFAKVQEFVRFFAVPGMGHCGGGPGLNTIDVLPVLEDWVERGQAPDHIVASRVEQGTVRLSRPVCAYQSRCRTIRSGWKSAWIPKAASRL
jgi:feruloyl esterase